MLAAIAHPPGRTLRLPAQPESVARARHEMADLAAQAGADPGDVALAVSEAVGNAVQHGYRHGGSGEVELDARVDDDAMVVCVTDRGVGMSPNPDSTGLGFGVSIIGSLTQSFSIAHLEPGTRVRMRFALQR